MARPARRRFFHFRWRLQSTQIGPAEKLPMLPVETERFGPVRAVKALRVFELGFEGISRSERHKSGFAVRFPRILRERTDKRPEDADGISTLEQLLQSLGPVSGSGSGTVVQQGTPPALASEQMSFDLSDRPERA